MASGEEVDGDSDATISRMVVVLSLGMGGEEVRD